jgi:hypothetical protein
VQARYFGLDNLVDQLELRMRESRVRINAGGQLFETSRDTVMKQPHSRLGTGNNPKTSSVLHDDCGTRCRYQP